MYDCAQNNSTGRNEKKEIQWQTTSARCVTGGGFFPQETSDEMENEFKDLVVGWVL